VNNLADYVAACRVYRVRHFFEASYLRVIVVSNHEGQLDPIWEDVLIAGDNEADAALGKTTIEIQSKISYKAFCVASSCPCGGPDGPVA
jgi:hypothetical protein